MLLRGETDETVDLPKIEDLNDEEGHVQYSV